MARSVFGGGYFNDFNSLFWNVLGFSDEDDDELQLWQALMDLPPNQAENTLAQIEKIMQSVMKNPSSERHRQIRLDNPKTAELITKVPGAIEALTAAGWVLMDPSTLQLPHDTCPTPREVIQITDAQDYYRRQRIDSDPDKGVKNILAGY